MQTVEKIVVAIVGVCLLLAVCAGVFSKREGSGTGKTVESCVEQIDNSIDAAAKADARVAELQKQMFDIAERNRRIEGLLREIQAVAREGVERSEGRMP